MLPMFTASFYCLGLAGFIVAALVCLLRGRHTDQNVAVDLRSLRTAAVCFLAGCRAADRSNSAVEEGENAAAKHEKAKWREMKTLWLQWYAQCQEQAFLKQKALLSWGRTLVICALLCLVGVCLEVQFSEPISVDKIFAGLIR